MVANGTLASSMTKISIPLFNFFMKKLSGNFSCAFATNPIPEIVNNTSSFFNINFYIYGANILLIRHLFW